VEGLEGEADLDGDGRITVDEVYDYAYEKVRLATPKQTPSKFSSKQQGEIVLRQFTRIEDIKPVSLPSELMEEIEDTRPYVREAAVQKLEKILKGRNIGLARSAREALEKIAIDDNTTRRVSQMATQLLESIRQQEQKAEAERKANEEAERLAILQAEEERLAAEKAEAERLFAEQKAEAERKAKKEAKRLAALKAKEERLVREKAEADQLARQKAEEERRAKEEAERLLAEHRAEQERRSKEEAKRLAAIKAEEERLAVEKAESERKAKEEAERLLAEQKAEEERKAREEAEHLAILRAEEELLLREKAAEERKAREEAEDERLTAEKVERERTNRATPPKAQWPATHPNAEGLQPAKTPSLSAAKLGLISSVVLIILVAALVIYRGIASPPATGAYQDSILAYTCNNNICLVNDSGEVLRTFEIGLPFGPIWMTWSPNGAYLVFGSNLSGLNEFESSELYTLDIRTSDLRQLTSNQSGDMFPAWSPDSSKIAFVSERNGRRNPFVMNADGSNQLQLSEEDTQAVFWTPNGLIGFVNNNGLYLINADGTDQRLLISDDITDASWSPDGKSIAYLRNCQNDCEAIISNEDGGDKQPLLTNPNLAAYYWTVHWSPDSRSVALEVRLSDEDYEIFVVDISTRAQTNVSNYGGSDLLLGWSPRDGQVVFHSSRDPAGIYVVQPDGTNPRYIAPITHADWGDISP
jgi:hypothetical protein